MVSESNIRNYIDRCFQDSFAAENRQFNKSDYSAEWIMVKNANGKFQFYPIINCKYKRVERRVLYRLENNFKKNFGLVFGDTLVLMCVLYDNGGIDLDNTYAMFQTAKGNISLSIFDCNLPESRYNKLILKYWSLDVDSYRNLPLSSEKRYLPLSFQYDWDAFKKLYKDTFGRDIGNQFEIICSSGIKRI